MVVKELIEKLKEFNPHAKIQFITNDGRTVDNIDFGFTETENSEDSREKISKEKSCIVYMIFGKNAEEKM